MPLYEYECDTCGHRFEVIQKFSDQPVEKCPKCGASVHKLISSPAFQFKGSGWYVTDYPKKDHGGGKSEDKSGAAKEAKEARDKDTGGSAGKADKSEKVEKTDKTEKSDKADKSDRGSTASGDSSSTSTSTTTTTTPKKD